MHMTQPYVPAINISLKNHISINLMSKQYGSQSYRESSGTRKSDLAKKVQ